MEKAIQKIQSKKQIALFSKVSSLSLPAAEQKIIERKYIAPPIGMISQEEIFDIANVLLLKIHVITGWNFPKEKEYQIILKDQFRKKIQESYPNLNTEEIEFAFRNNTTVKDWGKNMNLSLIDEVMIDYMLQRREASKQEEMASLKLLPGIPKETVSDDEIIEISRSIYLKTNNWKFISAKTFSLLNLQLDEAQRQEIITQAKHYVNEELGHDKNLLNHIPKEKLVDRYCKKIAVAKYFQGKIKVPVESTP